MQFCRSPTNFKPSSYQPHAPLDNVPSSVQFHPKTPYCNQQMYMEGKLPPVNHDQAVKRAKIQFTGPGDMFIFYNQLSNSMEQFGIYLVPLNQVKHQVDLCPLQVNGVDITERCQQHMASTLYQKLQNIDVIPREYTSIRNIINRFAECNDTYAVLYTMLELVHPALQCDTVILPPKLHKCDDDIHLYYQKFDAWLHYETYANRPYSARE
jgi:hypothetical protein